MRSEGLVLVPHCQVLLGDLSVAPPPGDGVFGVHSPTANEIHSVLFKRNIMPDFRFGGVAAPKVFSMSDVFSIQIDRCNLPKLLIV